MRKITRFPIYPTKDGLMVVMPAGSRIVTASKNCNQFYLHVSCQHPRPLDAESRLIVAYADEEVTPDDVGTYIASVPDVGRWCHWHFYALELVQPLPYLGGEA